MHMRLICCGRGRAATQSERLTPSQRTAKSARSGRHLHLLIPHSNSKGRHDEALGSDLNHESGTNLNVVNLAPTFASIEKGSGGGAGTGAGTGTGTELAKEGGKEGGSGSGSGAGAGAEEKKLPPVEAAKRLAAYAAVDAHVEDHHKVIGIGSGSTVPYVVERIIQQDPKVNEGRWFIPTGFQSKELIVKAGLNLGDVDQFPSIDVTIDGADEVDDDLNAIKGGGACHLREKVLAEAAQTFIIVADHRKDSRVLGTTWKQGVPIEVAPFAWAKVFYNLQRMGCLNPVLRMGKAKAGPLVSDNGNFVIDAPFDEVYMRDPSELLHRIKMLTGVLEVGIFAGMAQAAYFGNEDGSVTIRYANGQSERKSASEAKKNTKDSVPGQTVL